MTETMTESERKDWSQAALAASDPPRPGDIYRHYKGGLYVVVCCSIKEDTLEHLVTCRSNLKGTCSTRTLANFRERLCHAANNPGGPCPRFARVDEEN